MRRGHQHYNEERDAVKLWPRSDSPAALPSPAIARLGSKRQTGVIVVVVGLTLYANKGMMRP